MKVHRPKLLWFVGVSALVSVCSFGVSHLVGGLALLPSGLTWLEMIGVVIGVMTICGLLTLVTHLVLARRNKPPAEGVMIGRLYWLLGIVGILVSITYGFGVLGTFGTLFSLFGGMLLGWSLQAPVSGFAAWILVSIKRPFRPGDRVQFPGLALTGDIKDVGVMYMVLDQVGGSIGSEEAVGRDILVPNAMLFSQVAINYTVSQDAYMLDEVVVRITYDSNWTAAEKVLMLAAETVTRDVIEATGEKPYIRADLYDYGVYLRLRYQTRVKDRAETSYHISKLIFEAIQHTPAVDIAIPFVYSYRAGQDWKNVEDLGDSEGRKIHHIDVASISAGQHPVDPEDVKQLAISIKRDGLLQPVVLTRKDGTDRYDIMAGQLRFEACKQLGWRTVPALVRNGDGQPRSISIPPGPQPPMAS